MKCPQTFQIEITEDDQIQLAGADCIKEECAWWDIDQEGCGIHAITTFLHHLYIDLAQIRDKMPHEEQFRK